MDSGEEELNTPLGLYTIGIAMTGQELRRARRRLKMTQRQLATTIEIHWNTVARSERGEMAIHRTTELAVKYLLLMRKLKRGKKK